MFYLFFLYLIYLSSRDLTIFLRKNGGKKYANFLGVSHFFLENKNVKKTKPSRVPDNPSHISWFLSTICCLLKGGRGVGEGEGVREGGDDGGRGSEIIGFREDCRGGGEGVFPNTSFSFSFSFGRFSAMSSSLGNICCVECLDGNALLRLRTIVARERVFVLAKDT